MPRRSSPTVRQAEIVSGIPVCSCRGVVDDLTVYGLRLFDVNFVCTLRRQDDIQLTGSRLWTTHDCAVLGRGRVRTQTQRR